MFELLKDPNFDFMGKRKIFLVLSAVLVVASIALIATNGFNKGIEFTGGTELQIKFAETPDLGSIRSALAGISDSSPVVTSIGDPAKHEVYIKIGASAATGEDDSDARREQQEQTTTAVIDALQPGRDPDKLDLNIRDSAVLTRTLSAAGISRAEEIADAILAKRKETAIFTSLDELRGLPGMTPEAMQVLEQSGYLGPFSLRSQSYIGPAIGEELMTKAQLAILGSLLGMLIYIWIRFQVQWGLAAVVALSHDTLITLGLFSLFGKELTLPVVAAFLTLVGYSVNDTVVVFDRIRENLRVRGARNMVEVVNRSINQTLSRTVITTSSTWIVVVGLFLFGGEALNAFAFVLTFGIIVGTYSSVFVASPILVLWQHLFAQWRSKGRKVKAAPGRTVKKVRTKTAS